MSALESVYQNDRPVDLIKSELVNTARIKWPLLFSFFFEAFKLSGPPLEQNEIIIAINWTGICFTNEKEEILLELTYLELVSVSVNNKLENKQCIQIQTIAGEDYLLETLNAEEINGIVQYFLEGLKTRSKYLITISASKEENQSPDFLR